MLALLDALTWPRQLFNGKSVITRTDVLAHEELVVILLSCIIVKETHDIVTEIVIPTGVVFKYGILCFETYEELLHPTHGITASVESTFVLSIEHDVLKLIC